MKTIAAAALATSTGGTGIFTRPPLREQDKGDGGGAGNQAPEPTQEVVGLEDLVARVVAKVVPEAVKQALDTAPQRKPAVTKHMANFGPTQREIVEDGPVIRGVRLASEGTGINFVRCIKALAVSRLEYGRVTPDEVLKGWNYPELANSMKAWGSVDGVLKALGGDAGASVLRALGTSIFADGGAVVPSEFSTEIVALLRNLTVVRSQGARTLPLSGTLDIPTQDSAGVAYYVGENAAVTPSQQTVGNLKLSEKHLMALTPTSNKLLRNAAISAEEFIRDDLMQVLALKEDLTFLLGVGSVNEPRGLLNLLDSTHVYAATATDPKVPTLAEVKAELAKAIARLETANMPFVKRGWIMSPRTKQYLYGITETTGATPFEKQLDEGKLRGFPYVLTNQFAENINFGVAADGTYLALVEWPQLIIGQAEAIAAEVFPNGTYESGGSVVSGISRDQSVVRLIAAHDFNVRYPKCAVFVKIRWGAP